MKTKKFVWDPEIAARKERNRAIFDETRNICKAGWYETPSGRRVELPPTQYVVEASRFYENPPSVKDIPVVGTTVMSAVNADCVHVAKDIVRSGYRPILLNMANRHTPGGGVLNGARAQEESLFRQSNLCVSLYQYEDEGAKIMKLPRAVESYPMNRDTGGIYSNHIFFFREGMLGGDKLVDEPFTCAVVSVAAINRPELDGSGRLVPWAIAATEKKIRTMLRIGLLHGHNAIVLGAFGCGAFRNPPEHMAEIFHRVLNEPEFANKYKVVRFAIIEDHNSRHGNYAAFDKEFNQGAACSVSEGDVETLAMVREKVAKLRDPGFPKKLTAEMLKGFETTGRGCTHPRVGTIDAHRFIAKCGSWSAYSSDEHVHNEYVADNLLRAAGLNVPFSREYRVDFGDGCGQQTIRLAVYDDTLMPIMQAWQTADGALRTKIRAQTVAAYPVQALIAGIDTFTWDNVRVDSDGGLWFVDNGASFDFRACGKKKGWYWKRVEVDDPRSGFLSLARHPDQCGLQRILGTVDADELWAAAGSYRFRELVEQLPEGYRRRELADYAEALDAAAMRVAR